MKTVYVKFYSPNEVFGDEEEITDEKVLKHCFKTYEFYTEYEALVYYAETPGTLWSTLLDNTVDVKSWIKEAYKHIKEHDIDWLEQNFV